MAPAPRVLIAGGGIAGLAAAVALARVGIGSVVLERRSEFSDAGAGIQIGPNGVHVLDALGVRAAVADRAGRPDAIEVREGRTGRILSRLPLGAWVEDRHGAPYLTVHRRDLQSALVQAAAAAAPVALRLSANVVDISRPGDAIAIDCSNGERLEGEALIGADGVFSLVRKHVEAGAFRQPAFAGRTAARTVVAAERFARHLASNTTGVWLAPGAHVVHYPVRSGREVAVVVVREEDWSERDWSGEVDRDALMDSLKGFAPELRHALSEAGEWRRWALFSAPKLKRWVSGRIALLGDAAHPVLPFLAQGGCLALEDAVVLAAAVAAAPGNLPAALRAFEDARRDRATAVARASEHNGRIYHLGGMAARMRDLAIAKLPPARILARYDWLYGWRPPRLTPP
jgi:salicylate hydroxylase